MQKPIVVYGGGVGLGGFLSTVFIVLKLCHVIDWSWWFVLMPIYGPIALIFGTVFIIIVSTLVYEIIANFIYHTFGWVKRCKRNRRIKKDKEKLSP